MTSSLLLLAAVLLVTGAWLAAAVVALMAWSLLRPPRMTDGKAVWLLRRLSPGDLGMPYEESPFDVRDARSGRPLRIAAWWIPCPGRPTASGGSAFDGGAAAPRESDRCVVLLHGYADAKVGAIAWAPVWHALGYNVLAPDLRAHGESGGRYTTAGYDERHDLDQVLTRLRADRPAATRHVVLFGASLGAAVAVATAAVRDDLAAVVLESPFADFRAASRVHMDLLGLPGGAMQRAALRLAEWLADARFDEVRPVALLPTLRCPVLVIAPEDDVFLAGDEAEALRAALASRPDHAGPGEVWRVEGAGHLLGVHADAAVYTARLASFLDRALSGSPKTASAEPAEAPSPA